jgi:hypothetical protein
MVGYSQLFVFVLGLVTKNIEQLCEERNRSSHFLPFFRDQKPETTGVKVPSLILSEEQSRHYKNIFFVGCRLWYTPFDLPVEDTHYGKSIESTSMEQI